MASTLVDGLRLPLSIGGHPAIDFCNTRAGWGAVTPKEYLVDYRHLAVWAREAGLLTASTTQDLLRQAARQPRAAGALAGAAIDYRTSLYDVLVGQGTASAWEHVCVAAGAAAAAAELTAQAPGAAIKASWQLPAAGPLELALLAVILAASELLTSPLGASVCACPSPDCGWAFANPSGRRTWCSMAWCGNRAKVRRFAERHRT
jgi:predicted RNA-binding Zn ribbon-like protein